MWFRNYASEAVHSAAKEAWSKSGSTKNVHVSRPLNYVSKP